MLAPPDLGDDFHEMWAELFWLHTSAPAPWVLIGAQMVAVHGWIRGRKGVRPSQDADVLVNVRMVSRGTELMGEALIGRGYDFTEASPEGIGHRFVRESTSLDVMCSVGTGSARVRSCGSSRELARFRFQAEAKPFEEPSTSMPGHVAGRIVPVPDLLGAILVKIRAIDVDDGPKLSGAMWRSRTPGRSVTPRRA